MKYKVGDRVKVKSLDWYNYNKDGGGNVDCGGLKFVELMSAYCGRTLTIKSVVNGDSYRMVGVHFFWTDDMIEGLADEEQDYILHIEKDWDKEQEIQIADGYEFQDENDNVINARKVKIVKKKPKYPTTYEKCCKVLSLIPCYNVVCDYYRGEKLGALYHLLICRDVYWKIAGEEMGLGEPWKPDWEDESDKFTIGYFYNGIDTNIIRNYESHLLAFPTKEMRDAFYENFKDLIEQCKELL